MESYMEEESREHLYKVLMIGEYGVGKNLLDLINSLYIFMFRSFVAVRHYQTSIIRRYTEGFFSPNYKLTIGVDFALKVIQWDEGTKINLQLWDVAGHERFGHMTRVYYKYAIAAIIVYDISRPATFEAVMKWHKDINQKVMLTNENPIPVLLLANKCDIEDCKVDEAKLNQFCIDNGFAGWFLTSAKEDTNIDEAMRFLVQTILSLSGECNRPRMEDVKGRCTSPSFSLDGSDYWTSRYMSDYRFRRSYPNSDIYTPKKKSCCSSN